MTQTIGRPDVSPTATFPSKNAKKPGKNNVIQKEYKLLMFEVIFH